MSAIDLALRLILAATFVVAGVAKLGDREGSRHAVLGFGLPDRLAGPISIVVPLAELAAAALLIGTATAQVGAALALALLVAFCAAIARSMLRGEAPECHCFGQLHSAPAGPKTLARNLVLDRRGDDRSRQRCRNERNALGHGSECRRRRRADGWRGAHGDRGRSRHARALAAAAPRRHVAASRCAGGGARRARNPHPRGARGARARGASSWVRSRRRSS